MQPLYFLYGSLAISLLILIYLVTPRVRNRMKICLGLFFLLVFLIHIAVVLRQTPAITVNDALFGAMIGMFQTFSLDVDYQGILSVVREIKDAVWLRVFVQIILVIAPVVGGAAVLTIIMNVFPNVRYRMHLFFCKKLYIFSALDERSLYIANSLIEKKRLGRWDCIVFANTSRTKSGDGNGSLLYKAANLDAISMCLEKSPENLMIPEYVSVYYDFAKKDEMENINDAFSVLTAKKRELENVRGQVCFYIYAQPGLAAEVAEKMFAVIRKEKKKNFYISIIPYITNAVYKTLTEFPLHKNLGGPEKKEALSVAVIGDNAWALELIKTCYWAGQYPNKTLRIVSFSKDAKAMEDRIHTIIPEWDAREKDYSYCEFSFQPYIQDSDAFRAEMESCNIWFVALENQKDNISVGEALVRRLNGIHLTDQRKGTVFCRIEDENVLSMANLAAKKKLPFTLCGFGCIRDQYAPSFVEDDQISFGWISEGNWAQFYNKPRGYVDFDYGNRSTKAAALHLPAKMYTLGLGQEHEQYKQELLETFIHFLSDEKLRKTKTSEIASLEHRRWCAYVRSDGFVKADIKDWMDYYEASDKAGDCLPTETRSRRRGLHTCLEEYDRDEHDIRPYLLPQAETGEAPKRDWTRIREQYEKARKAQAAGSLDGFDLVMICLYNMGKTDACRLKAYDAVSVTSLVSCYVVYDALKKILSFIYGTEVRYSDPLSRYVGWTCTTKWLSRAVIEKLVNICAKDTPYRIGADVLARIRENGDTFEKERKKQQRNIRTLTVGEYAKILSKDII